MSLLEERATIDKRTVTTGKVSVRTEDGVLSFRCLRKCSWWKSGSCLSAKSEFARGPLPRLLPVNLRKHRANVERQ